MIAAPVAHRALKVCHIAATTEGAVWVFEQLRELRDRHGFDVSAILSGDHGALADKMRAAGIPVHAASFDFSSNSDFTRLPGKVLRLVRILRRERFDIVQTHLFHSMVLGRIAAWFADVPTRFSMIAGPFHLEAYTPRWIDKYTRWIDTATIASCTLTRTLYEKMAVSKDCIDVIYYGPDQAKFDPSSAGPADLRAEFNWAPDTPLIGMVAYFYPVLPRSHWIPPALWHRSVKSQEDLIRAVPFVLREFPRARFLLIGTGWEEGGQMYFERMQRLVVDLGLQQHVRFTGFRTDIPEVLRALDVAVQPSLSENLGGTIESLLMECPTVATRVGGMVDSVLDGQTGVLVDPSDPASLADGIMRMLRDPVAARKLAAAGRQRMLAGFTLLQTAERLAALYRRHAGRPGYRRYVALPRLTVGSILCLIIVARYLAIDAWLMRRWPRIGR